MFYVPTLRKSFEGEIGNTIYFGLKVTVGCSCDPGFCLRLTHFLENFVDFVQISAKISYC